MKKSLIILALLWITIPAAIAIPRETTTIPVHWVAHVDAIPSANSTQPSRVINAPTVTKGDTAVERRKSFGVIGGLFIVLLAFYFGIKKTGGSILGP